MPDDLEDIDLDIFEPDEDLCDCDYLKEAIVRTGMWDLLPLSALVWLSHEKYKIRLSY
jgi:hypothetical protein